MIAIRARFKILGGHVHVRVFASLHKSDHMPKSGDLVFTVEEWPHVLQGLARAGWETIDETPSLTTTPSPDL